MGLVFFDLETTGVDPLKDRIVEIAMVHEGSVCIITYVNPGMSIPPEATAIHGITNEMVADSPYFEDIAERVQAFVTEQTLVGYNSKHFDSRLLDVELRRVGQPGLAADQQQLDLYVVWNEVERRTLSNAMRRYVGERPPDAHRAHVDVTSTMRLIKAMHAYHDLSYEEMIEVTRNSDLTRWVEKRNDVWVFKFGKHRGKRLTEDLDYANWILNADFPEALKRLIRMELMV